MKYFAQVNEMGFMQVRHDPGDGNPKGDEIEVSEEVAREPGFYDISDSKVKKRPKHEIDKMLANRKEAERKRKKMEELLK